MVSIAIPVSIGDHHDQKPRIAVIIGSTRDTRFADKPAAWIFDLARQRSDWEVELLDLRDFDLPLFNERSSNLWVPTEDPKAVAWQKKLATFDGFIFVVAEYNRSITGRAEERARPGLQGVDAQARRGGRLRLDRRRPRRRAPAHIAIELQMVPVRSGVHIMGADLMKVHPMGENGPISEIEDHILPSAKAMLADLDWWVHATMAARAARGARRPEPPPRPRRVHRAAGGAEVPVATRPGCAAPDPGRFCPGRRASGGSPRRSPCSAHPCRGFSRRSSRACRP